MGFSGGQPSLKRPAARRLDRSCTKGSVLVGPLQALTAVKELGARRPALVPRWNTRFPIVSSIAVAICFFHVFFSRWAPTIPSAPLPPPSGSAGTPCRWR